MQVIEILVPNGPDDCEWAEWGSYVDYAEAKKDADKLIRKGHTVRIWNSTTKKCGTN